MTAEEIIYYTVCVQCRRQVVGLGTGNPIAVTSQWISADGIACPAGPLSVHEPHRTWLAIDEPQVSLG